MFEILEDMENLSEFYDMDEDTKKKIRKKEWVYLEKMDKNLLYTYANVLSGKNKIMRLVESKGSNVKDIDGNSELDESKKQYLYYLIWFVYRYILKCETYEQTIPYQTKEILNKYKLLSYIQTGTLYIGIGEDRVAFRKVEDIPMILEILYNRYSFMEQIDCFIRNTKKTRQKLGIQLKERLEQKISVIIDTLNKGGYNDIFH